MPTRGVYVAHTRRAWFDYLSTLANTSGIGGSPSRLDEVNFWSPQAPIPLKGFIAAEPIFFRLGVPTRSIAGYGFFATFHSADVPLAWDLFGPKNGAPTQSELARLLGRRTLADLRAPLGCTVLRNAVFWPEPRWIPWGRSKYPDTGVQRGRTETDPANVELLLEAVSRDGIVAPRELQPAFVPLEIDERRSRESTRIDREGQGTFRLRLLAAYGGRCAITHEHTEPVLDAAHIQPYVGPMSNHPQNGLVLTKEFHTLFDKGLATIEPPAVGRQSYRLRLSEQIKERWNNGRRYYEYRDQEVAVPEDPALRPSSLALDWHHENVFER